MEVTSQSDQFGLPEYHRPIVSAEKVAEQLTPPPLFSGPSKIETGE